MTVDPGTLRLLYDYLRWADGRALEAASRLSAEQYVKDLGSSHKSVRDTLVHIASSQWMWLSRWKGTSPKAMWPAAEFPTLDAIRAKWTPLREELDAFVADQTEATLRRDVGYVTTDGKPKTFPLGPLMLHCVNHASYHRGQVTTLLRQLGAQPVSTDLVLYLAERPKA